MNRISEFLKANFVLYMDLGVEKDNIKLVSFLISPPVVSTKLHGRSATATVLLPAPKGTKKSAGSNVGI